MSLRGKRIRTDILHHREDNLLVPTVFSENEGLWGTKMQAVINR